MPISTWMDPVTRTTIMADALDAAFNTKPGKWVTENWEKAYNSQFGQKFRNFVYGEDYYLTDDEYLRKHGKPRPFAGTSLGDMLTGADAGRLFKLQEELRLAEEAAKEAKLAKLQAQIDQSGRQAEILKNASDLRIAKSGKLHFKNKKEVGNKSYVKAATSGAPIKTVETVTKEGPKITYEDLVNASTSAENARAEGLPKLAEWFDQDFKDLWKVFNADNLKTGGSIHIKPENRGKFTEYCGGKVTEECIARGKRSPDPKIRRQATFAANSRSWNK